MSKFLKDAKNEDIYPDFYGVDNIAVYLDNDEPRIALVDSHIVHIGSGLCPNNKGRFERVVSRFERFLKDPISKENVEFLTSDRLM